MANEKEVILSNTNLEALRTISGIIFTAREMEILACVISVRGIKKIASVLSISPKTAETHVRNIMLKIQCNSRESIVDFIEQSGKLPLIKNHYQHLISQESFEESFSEENFLQLSSSSLESLEIIDNSNLARALKPHPSATARLMPFFSLTLINNSRTWVDSFFKIKNQTPYLFKRNPYTIIGGLLLLILAAALVYLLLTFSKATKNPSHHSKSTKDFYRDSSNITASYTAPVRIPFSLPHETALLDQSDLIQEMIEKFNKQKDIQTIALVGIGGAGKTTLTRQYERYQNASVVWEINADTPYSLGTSFKDLAYALARTPEQREELTFIQNIQDSEERAKQILSFVRKTLKENPGWLLIYDNVSTFADIRSYFPTESALWGTGQVIITTQDLNIENSLSAENIIYIGELTPEKQFTLFVKIFHNCDFEKLSQEQKNQARDFLKKIPPFPLDVSVAAHYMNSHHLSYDQYLDRVSQLSQDFEKSQQLVLKETTDYTKTRYGIIISSLEKLISTNPHFKELLLIISLLDSQKIPKDLLDFYKDPVVVEDFIQELKKYSLIIESQQDETIQTLSLHRNTQSIALSYITKILKLEENHHFLGNLVNTLEKYIRALVENEDVPKMKLIKNHCKKLGRSSSLLTETEREIVNGALGGVYFWLSNFVKAQKILEKSLSVLEKQSDHKNIRIAYISEYLSGLYRQIYKFSEAKNLLEKSLKIYAQDPIKFRYDIARTLGYLGITSKGLGESEKGIALLKQSLQFYEQNPPKNPVIAARMSAHLGIIYKQQGMFEEAKKLFEKSLVVFTPKYPQNVAWVYAQLGDTYKGMGDYKKAKNLIEESMHIFNRHSPHNPTDTAWVMIYLGRVFEEIGYYQKAKEIYEQSIVLYKKYFAEHHPTVAQLGIYLGGVLLECNQLEKAKEITEQNVAWQKGLLHPNHIYLARSARILGKVYTKLGIYDEAISLLENSLVGYEKCYGPNHTETAQIYVLLGRCFLLKGLLEKSEEYLQKAYDIYKSSNHTRLYQCLEVLGKLYNKKAELSAIQNDKQNNQYFITKAIEHIRQALEIVKEKFPNDSPHFTRIKMTLSKFETAQKM